MKLTLERQIPLGFVIAIFLLAVILFFAFQSMNSINETLSLEKHTQTVLLQLDEMLILMVNAETGARVWQLCDGRRTVREISDQIAREFDADPATALSDVLHFLEALASRGLLAPRGAEGIR